jgi:hypothetical protein
MSNLKSSKRSKVWKFTMPKGWHLARKSEIGWELPKNMKIVRTKGHNAPAWDRYDSVKR